MNTLRLLLLLIALPLAGCLSAEETFIGAGLPILCDDAYYICNVTAGCILDEDHYLEGVFPGTRRVVFVASVPEQDVRVRFYLKEMEAPGTELMVRIFEPSCTMGTANSSASLTDVDLFEEAGDDRTIIFELSVLDDGEHLVEIFSDASATYLLVIEPM